MKQIFGDSQEEDSSSDFEVSQHLTTFMGVCERTREADVARPRQNRHVKWYMMISKRGVSNV